MQFNVVFIATALLASASLAMSATITGFDGAACTDTTTTSFEASVGECFNLGNNRTKSISYSGVPGEIKIYISGDCTNVSLVRGSGSGCATAPSGSNWGSVEVFQ